ncbi:MAG: biotin transporter BioY [Oscillospiraceae bacterium]|nr:biotin transporter BioY [Oscillospiraceae bacterium]MCD7792252.1 biotin transporter BioY [Oscillospiraceae bacterium]MCD8066322.1 biotin transporter BioY [Oscillospiraceae bacterium]MCD8099606.1 biotin transporter BioY [Oscillospiraceae bacterium]MCD8255290.1 biotin transporter BioY [Oscillospiraceae bacterium]
MQTSQKTRALVYTAVLAAIICVLAPWSIPTAGGVSITLATLAVYIVGGVSNWKTAVTAVIVYILIGAVGVPVFSNFSGGVQKLIGPTGGYIVGYIPGALIISLIVKWCGEKKWSYPVGMVAGTLVIYALGTAWYCIQTGTALAPAMAACVIPFLPLDTVKVILASVISAAIHPLTKKFGQ